MSLKGIKDWLNLSTCMLSQWWAISLTSYNLTLKHIRSTSKSWQFFWLIIIQPFYLSRQNTSFMKYALEKSLSTSPRLIQGLALSWRGSMILTALYSRRFHQLPKLPYKRAKRRQIFRRRLNSSLCKNSIWQRQRRYYQQQSRSKRKIRLCRIQLNRWREELLSSRKRYSIIVNLMKERRILTRKFKSWKKRIRNTWIKLYNLQRKRLSTSLCNHSKSMTLTPNQQFQIKRSKTKRDLKPEY